MTYRWFIEPRDPIVVREGRSAAALDETSHVVLPLPSVLAGLVRTCFVTDTTKVDAEELLRIRISQGPWFGRWNDASFEPWIVSPHDAVMGTWENEKQFRHAQIRHVEKNKGAVLFSGASKLSSLVIFPERDGLGQKTKPASEIEGHRFWTLDRAVLWATSCEDVVVAAKCKTTDPLVPETRLHVAIDDTTGTAEAGMLYGTPGLRFAEGFGFALEASDVPERLSKLPLPKAVFLGGEGRVSFRKEVPDDVFPVFTKYRSFYENAAQEKPSGLRIQLLTPAWLQPDGSAGEPGWLPSWWQTGKHPALPEGMRLHLVAVCLPRPLAISGWDMQWRGRGGPRRVRRLAPAGSIYYFEVRDEKDNIIHDPDTLVDVAEKLWARPLEMPTSGERSEKWKKEHVAHPAHDGFGQMLPGFFWTSQWENKRESAS